MHRRWSNQLSLEERCDVNLSAGARRVEWRLVDQAFKTFSQPVRLRNQAASEALPRTFVYCIDPAIGPYDRFAEMARMEGWRYREIATGHFPMVTPRRTADLLLELA